jgi:uncharacterized membrane protein YkvA (DUF1232 family)
VLEKLRAWARALKTDLVALWFCRRHPDTPWYAKLLAALVVAYAFSPIDLIPDFIPVLGYLDDLIIVPLGVYLTLRLIPQPVLAEARARATTEKLHRRGSGRARLAGPRLLALDAVGHVRARVLGACAALVALAVHGAPNEIKVFTDELAAYHAHTLETHVNKARTGPLRVMPEYSYGLWHDWELSLQLPMAFTSDAARGEGYRAELQYIAPHDEERGLYWGLNVELARDAPAEGERFWNVELIPIVGWRNDRWHFAANPGGERALSGSERKTIATPAVKLAYRAFGREWLGLEHYRDEQGRTLYLAWDGKLGRSDINVGLGRGLSGQTDRWVMKAIYEFAF